jgi:hypothetical protein
MLDGRIEPLFLNTKVLGFSYGKFDEAILNLPNFDYIIGSDLFYDNSDGMQLQNLNVFIHLIDYEDIIASVSYFFSCNPNAIFFTTCQNRTYVLSLSFVFNYKALFIS